MQNKKYFGGGNNNMKNINQAQQQIQVDLKNATQRFCECGCPHFKTVTTLYVVSALQSPNGQELLAQMPVLICQDCEKVFVK